MELCGKETAAGAVRGPTLRAAGRLCASFLGSALQVAWKGTGRDTDSWRRGGGPHKFILQTDLSGQSGSGREGPTHRLWKPLRVLCGWHLRAHQPSHTSCCRHQSSLMVSQHRAYALSGDPPDKTVRQRERLTFAPDTSSGSESCTGG